MSSKSELAEWLENNKELFDELFESWRRGVPIEKIAAVLYGAGIEVDANQIQDVFGETQRRSCRVIAFKELDEEALDQVAGGFMSRPMQNTGKNE